MRFSSISVFAAVICVGCSADLPDAVLDRGGVTFDLDRMSEERFPDIEVDEKKDFFGDVWNGTVTNSPTRIVALPHDRGGKYRVICTSRVTQTKPDSVAVMIRRGTMSRRFVRTPYRPYVWCPLVRRPDKWRQMTRVFETRPGETHLWLQFLTKNAVVEVKDFAIVPETGEQADAAACPMIVHNLFSPNVNGSFAVGAGQAGQLGFVWKLAPEAKVSEKDVSFKVELPKGITYLGTTFGIPSTAETRVLPDGSSVTTFLGNEKVKFWKDWRWYTAGFIMVKAEDMAAGGDGRLCIVGKDASGKDFEAASETIRFFAVEPTGGILPKRFGVVSMMRDTVDFRDPEAYEWFAKFVLSMGVNWIMPNPVGLQPALPVLRRHGIAKITPQDCNWLRNGYEVAQDIVPAEERFVGAPWPWRDYSRLDRRVFCPLAISEEKPFFRTNSFAKVAALLKGTDGISCNWEPHHLAGRGCVCAHCLKAFAAWSGKSEKEVSAGWPTNVLKRYNGKWGEEGERFRCIQHANAIRTLNRLVTEITGGDRSHGLIPEVFFGHFASSWRDQRSNPESCEFEYARDFKWFQPWAPYVPWRLNGPYLKERSRRIACWTAARDVRRQMKLDYPDGERPKVCGSGAGPVDGYLMQPEEIAMELLAYFLNGFEAAGPWEFPSGADARYFKHYAEASSLIAKYENIVMDGEDVSESVTLVPEEGCYGTPVNVVMPRWLPEAKDMSQLQHAAFRKDGLTVVAAYNAWQEGEAFFRLKAGVPPGEWEIVSDDGTVWTGDASDGRWTRDDLARGVPLAVGACRCRMFEIRPAGRAGLTVPTHRMTGKRLAEIFAERRPALVEAAKRDAELAKYDIYGPSKVD